MTETGGPLPKLMALEWLIVRLVADQMASKYDPTGAVAALREDAVNNGNDVLKQFLRNKADPGASIVAAEYAHEVVALVDAVMEEMLHRDDED